MPTDLTLITDVTDSHRLVFVPHPTVDGSGKLTGLGSRAGRFVGTMEPEVLSGAIVQHGVPCPAVRCASSMSARRCRCCT